MLLIYLCTKNKTVISFFFLSMLNLLLNNNVCIYFGKENCFYLSLEHNLKENEKTRYLKMYGFKMLHFNYES